MKKKILFIFGGTGETAKKMLAFYSMPINNFKEDIVLVYFNGCDDFRINGDLIGAIKPDLNTVAKGVRCCFNEEGELSLKQLKQHFGNAIIIEALGCVDTVEVDEINLLGFSRGAVTTFAAARYLDDLGKPISIFADNPVPGNTTTYAEVSSSEFYKNNDLRHCKNLVHAEVVLGAYHKKLNFYFNKFFKQMVPIFPDSCNSIISITPKMTHLSPCSLTAELQQHFLLSKELTKFELKYSEKQDSKFFPPKILQQTFHFGVVGRVQLAQIYKSKLIQKLRAHYPDLNVNSSVKKGQALYALLSIPDGSLKEALSEQVISNNTASGKALREFIVEFENIILYINQAYPQKKHEPIWKDFRITIYTLLQEYKITEAEYPKKEEFYNKIVNRVKDLKGCVSYKEFNALQTIMQDFLRGNVLFHPDLTEYIDETETYGPKTITPEASARATTRIEDIRDADQLAERLYNLSDKSRTTTYTKYEANLPTIINNTDQLSNIIRFLPPVHYKKLLKKPVFTKMIHSIDEVNQILGKLFTAEQRKEVFTLLEPKIKKKEVGFEQLGLLMKYLGKNEIQSLGKTIIFKESGLNTSADMMRFFEQLNTEQINQLVPILEKKLAAYLLLHGEPDNGRMLYDFLKTKVSEGKASLVLTQIFDPLIKRMGNVHTFKTTLEQTRISSDPQAGDATTDIPR